MAARRLLTGKVVVVTGAAAGIGEGCAAVMAREGATIVVADVDVAKGEKVAEKLGSAARFFATDVKDSRNVQELFDFAAAEFGQIDGLVNNAGTHNGLGLATCEEEEFSSLIDLNLTSMFRTCKAALPHMQAAGGGSIVNMSSGVGLVGQDKSVAYASSKAGAIGMTKTLAVELGQYNIRCNAICPGYIETPLLKEWMDGLDDPDWMRNKIAGDAPLNKVGTIEDVGNTAAFLISDSSSFVSGTFIPVDGGLLCGYK